MLTAPTPASAARGRRLALVLIVGLYYVLLCRHPQWMAPLGASNAGLWFLDTHAVLAASDAKALGLDPYADNPLDILHQRHVYSDWWFGLRWLGLTRDNYIVVGAVWAFAFLAFALIQLEARSAGEVIWSAALATAPPIVLGFNRGNADLVIFLLLSALVPCLGSSRPAVRWLAPVLVFAAAGLKFYPIVAGAVLLDPHRSRREIGAMLLVLLAGTAGLSVVLADSFRHFLTGYVSPYGYFSFGFAYAIHAARLPTLAAALGIILLAIAGIATGWTTAPRWDSLPERPNNRLRFVLGATVLATCSIISENYGYRLVSALWMAPLLWSAWSRDDWPAWYRVVGRAAGILLFGMMWLDGLARLGMYTLTNWELLPESRAITLLTAIEQPLFAFWLAALLCFLAPWVRDSLRFLVAASRTAEA